MGDNKALNYRYMARIGTELGGTVLDFGCGRGEVVRLLREAGVDAYGADVFFGGMDWSTVDARLVDERRLREIADGRLPFGDATFDAVISDQVIEHVEDLDGAVAEMARVLKPDGRMYHQFPTLEVIREAHFNLPWSHRLRGRPQRIYMSALRRLGLGGDEPDITSVDDWVDHATAWLERYCHYRPWRAIRLVFERHGFAVAHREIDYCRYRASGWQRRLLAIDALTPASELAFRRLGFTAIECRFTSAPAT